MSQTCNESGRHAGFLQSECKAVKQRVFDLIRAAFHEGRKGQSSEVGICSIPMPRHGRRIMKGSVLGNWYSSKGSPLVLGDFRFFRSFSHSFSSNGEPPCDRRSTPLFKGVSS
jgi:hypothetical protein